MANEVELKLRVSPGELLAVSRSPWLQKLATGPLNKKDLVSVYFDTKKSKLLNHGLTLRVRHDGKKRIQTIKREANGADGALSRGEWEAEVGGDNPDLRLAKNSALEPLVTSKLKKALRPIFETKVRRIVVPVHFRGSEIELAFDRGTIHTRRHEEPISEIEIELKKGDLSDVAKLAARFAKTHWAHYLGQTKSARGYALAANAQAQPITAGNIVVDSNLSCGETFSVIGLSCLNHFAGNEHAVRAGTSEGIHQMRVGLRRLRASISIYKDIVDDEQTTQIKRELKWLTEQLGPARDFDVLVEEGVKPLQKAKPNRPEVSALAADLSDRRDAGMDRAKAAVESDRYRNLVLKTALWLIDGHWSKDGDPKKAAQRRVPVYTFAQETLQQRTKSIGKKMERLKELRAPQRHKLRIAAKKLRYATDFFGNLFSKAKARKRFERVLKSLQDALGKLNDVAVHERLGRDFSRPKARSKKGSQKAFAMGLLTGKELRTVRTCTAAAVQAGREVRKIPAFW